MKSTRRPAECEQNNFDVTSISGNVMMKNSSRGAKHGPSERQRMYYKAEEVLQKALQEKHGSHSSILARRYHDYEYRARKMLHDIIALENHSHVATKS